MRQRVDYSYLDQPHILAAVFYPRESCTPPPAGATDHTVPVDDGVSISCRFYSKGAQCPSILYFHGNGEVVCDYDEVAPHYNALGINLFVADYRGYGGSTGKPSFANLVADAHPVFDHFRGILRSNGHTGRLFVMGRSMGSMPAIELASNYGGQIDGLIIESASASLGRLLTVFFPNLASSRLQAIESANLERVRSITTPVVFIHGEHDAIIPHALAVEFFENIGSRDKKLVTIAAAGHTDLMSVGKEQYLSAIREFVFRSPSLL